MTSAQPPNSQNTSAPGYRAIRWNMDWITRPLFGLALAAIAIGVLFSPPVYFAVLVVAISWPAAHEWHRMIGGGIVWGLGTALSVLTVALSVAALLGMDNILLALLLVAAGAGLVRLLAGSRSHALWHAAGPVYLALPSLALVALRAFALPGALPIMGLSSGALVIIGLFVTVWATDSGALICGNLIGGPRLAPTLSPAKTWAGTIGGSVLAACVFGAYIALIGGAPYSAAAFALVFSIFAHAGDLFESFAKRRFGVKNSGALIPGHGGVLDRMDSTLSASMVLALLVFGAGFDPLFGAINFGA